MESNLDPQVPCASPFRNPFQPFGFPPLPVFVSPAGANGRRFAPINFGSGCAAKGFEDLLRPVHVGRGALQVKGYVVGKSLVSDQAAFGK